MRGQGGPGNLKLSKILIDISNQHYPETLGKCIILNSPRIFSWFWALVRPFIAEESQEKIEFITNWERLSDFVPPESRVVKHGGLMQGDYPSLYWETHATKEDEYSLD